MFKPLSRDAMETIVEQVLKLPVLATVPMIFAVTAADSHAPRPS